MKHLLVDLYQDCSYDAPGVKTGLAPGVTSSKQRNKDGKLQNFSWQGCSLGKALPKLFKRLNSNHNSGCHGNQNEKNSKIFENLLL